SIFAISTFNTDYILVRQDKEQEAVRVLSAAGYQVMAR
ncbi:MAG: ACT domain-containing protein, partial [Selenomonadaceae bacterium]|nr:ACT domain-containing protein [Selenomonadaceae bacterium]